MSKPFQKSTSATPLFNFTPYAQKALALAHREALLIGNSRIEPEHLMLGLLAVGAEVEGATAVLRALDYEAGAIHNACVTILAHKRPPSIDSVTLEIKGWRRGLAWFCIRSLGMIGITPSQIAHCAVGIDHSDKLTFSEKSRECLEQAAKEARSFKRGYLGTEHLLLGVLECTDALGFKSVNVSKVRHQVSLLAAHSSF